MNWSVSEKIIAVIESVGVVCLLAYFFYRSFIAIIPLSIAGALFFAGLKKKAIAKKLEELEMQFKECILSVSTSLKAGYAVENAFIESAEDMKQLYGGGALIVKELELIRRGIVVNYTLEELLQNFAKRSGSSNIRQFADVFVIAKRNGGNLPEIIKTTSEIIGRQIDSRGEIKAILSGRRMEQNIMKLMPFAIILYVGASSKGYFDSLYGNLQGVLIMTVCLGIYILAYFLGEKILGRLEKEM